MNSVHHVTSMWHVGFSNAYYCNVPLISVGYANSTVDVCSLEVACSPVCFHSVPCDSKYSIAYSIAR